MTTHTVVVDEGSTQVKVCWIENNVINEHVMLSNVGEDSKWAEDSNTGEFTDQSYTVDGEKMFVFDGDSIADRRRTDLARHQYSNANRVLVHEALRQAGFGGKAVDIICTLPVSQFYKPEGGKNEENIQKKKDCILGSIEHANKKPLADIVSCKVSSESTPAFHDHMISNELKINRQMIKMPGVFIIDIGGTTTDLMLMNGKGEVKNRDSIKTGVFEVHGLIRRKMSESKQVANITDTQMRHLIVTKKFRGSDVSTEIRQAINEVKNRISRELLKFYENPESLDLIIFAGGGAGLFGRELAEDYCQDAPNMNNVVISSSPAMSVSRGLLKAVISKNRKSK